MPIPDFAKHKTSYKKLHVYHKAEALYDLTYYFLQGHIKKTDRTYDQMLQAARSGKQNIVEGRTDAAGSAESEIKLYYIALGSLQELLCDYQDYMRTRNVPFWKAGHPRLSKLIDICKRNNNTEYYQRLLPKMNDEELCNLILTVTHQTISMLNKLIELVKDDFLKKGGIKEQMFRARLAYRNQQSNDNK